MEEYTFNDIVHFDDHVVQKILHEVDHHVIASALEQADTAVKDKIIRNVSKRVLSILKDDMKNMGPYDGKAQDKILEIMRYHIGTGKIYSSDIPYEFRYNDLETLVVGGTEIKRTFADMMECIEKACKEGHLYMPAYASTEDDAKKAFAAFQNRRNELARIISVSVDSKLLPAIFPLLEADTVRKLSVYGDSPNFHWSYLEKCRSLTSLEIRNLSTTSLPDWICNLENLTTLKISDSSFFEQLPDTIGNLKSLTELVLKNNKKLRTIPMSIGDLKSLTKLVLENNDNLRILPDSVSNLKNLTVLKIHRSPVVILPKNIINLTALEYVDIFGTKINSVPPSISSVKTFIANTRIELIPQEHSISYRSFVNCYYKIVETVIKFSNKALKEGLLALEEELEFLTVDFFWQGLRITVDGTDAKIIRQLMTVTIEREPDFYRKKLMEIAREGILCIQAGHRTYRIIFLLNSYGSY
jgi:hypothetical protein